MSKLIQMEMSTNKSKLTTKEAPCFNALDIKGWQGLSLEKFGLFVFMFSIAADADEFYIHASEDEWIAYVIAGSGLLYSGTVQGEKREVAAYQAGDFITFAADTPHGWKNDESESKILFLKKA